jgi:hypothetical protein
MCFLLWEEQNVPDRSQIPDAAVGILTARELECQLGDTTDGVGQRCHCKPFSLDMSDCGATRQGHSDVAKDSHDELATTRVFTSEQCGKGDTSKMAWKTRMRNAMPKDIHQRAAELHDLAAHAHRAAAAHHGKEDHQTGHEHSKQALEHANRAFQWSRKAYRMSVKSTGNP